jgi:L-ascorbate metabolism protein UlaG (beta-lactamase superfamily)
MELKRLDDYQSWALTQGGRRLLIDPWLTDEWSLPPGHWLFGRTRPAPTPVTAQLPLDALVMTSAFSDHLHPKTLALLPKSLPVFAARVAVKELAALGFTNITSVRDGERFSPWPGLEVEAVAPGFPFTATSNGYVFAADGKRLYLETHLVPLARAKERVGAVDLMVAPVQSVRLLGLPFAMGAERALKVARELAPKQWVPTGVDAHLAHGVFSKTMLFYRGAISDFRTLLSGSGLPTKLLEPAPGDSISV